MSPPVGPTGIAYCRGDDGPPPLWRVGASYGFASTQLHFGTAAGTISAPLTKHAVSGSLERRLGDHASVQLVLGATVGGELGMAGTAHRLLAGPLVAVGASYRVVDEGSARPFVILGGSLGASLGSTRDEAAPDAGTQALTAFDGRVGVTAGKTIAGAVSPYLAARAFGLPVLWHFRGESVTAGDAYHYQLGAGVVARVGDFDLLVEGVPLGERAVTAGVGWSF